VVEALARPLPLWAARMVMAQLVAAETSADAKGRHN
jgi:hypothetical protein